METPGRSDRVSCRSRYLGMDQNLFGGKVVKIHQPTLSGWWCNNYLEKYEFVNGKDDIPYMKWKITCLKPPTSFGFDRSIHFGLCTCAVYPIGRRSNVNTRLFTSNLGIEKTYVSEKKLFLVEPCSDGLSFGLAIYIYIYI